MSEESDDEEVEEGEWQEEEWGEEEYVDEEYECKERGEGELRQAASSSNVSDNLHWGSFRCACGSGLPSHFCYECFERVCSACHARQFKLPRALSFTTYVRTRRSLGHLKKDIGPNHPITVRMSEARRRLMETYGIDPDRDNAEEVYEQATSRRFTNWLVENGLTNSYDNALKYVLEEEIVVEGFSSEEIARAIHHCSRKVYETYVKELRKNLKQQIIFHFTHLITNGEDDRSHLDRLYKQIVCLSSAFSKSEPSLDHYIKTTIPTTLSNLSEGDGDVLAVREVTRLLDDAVNLHRGATGKPKPAKQLSRSMAAGKLLKAEKMFTEQLVNNLKEKFPEVADRVVKLTEGTIELLKTELEPYLKKASSESEDVLPTIEAYI
ncbi:MAG: hypothetical protein QW223_08360 [Candidatus Caldarchaeum sp.]